MKRIFFIIALSVTAISCDKFLDIEPKGKVIPQSTEEFRQLLNSGYRSVPTYKSDVAFRTDELKANENSDDFAQYKNIYIWEDVITDLQTKNVPLMRLFTNRFFIPTKPLFREQNECQNPLKNNKFLLRPML
ncbi:hypothetical protein CCAN11_1450004 [Capnocytophaga canimorsus]|uniref:SusD-like N-terminal domain-containing protein n=1 Tax=Capnocytophaga canimorsus TaxID=28188 RepID=A0A0B7IBU7_9FLAO|nr:RagB/SusD family nutrient uptake outer membrane protein [Capnocytophaga canimorsus]CEN47497.1 hypothetical protein CCAN11_1450004 [Capnocytophaga canimorsus]